MTRLFCLLLFVGLLIVPSAEAQTQPWTVDDLLKQESIADVDIHPDGDRILWTKRYPKPEKDRSQSDLFLTYLNDPHGSDEPATVRLTRTGDNGDPRWSPDGQHIAFASSRDHPDSESASGRQVWLLDPRGGEPYPLTSLENGIRGFEWLKDGQILLSAREDDTHHEDALKKAKDDTDAIEDTTLYRPVRLFTVGTDSKDVTRVSSNEYPIGEFAADPTGRYVVYSIDPSPVDADARNQPLQYLLDLDSGQRTEIFDEQYFDPSGFRWTRDGSGFYAQDTHSSDPENEGAGIQLLYYFDLTARSYEEVPLDFPNGVGAGGYAVVNGGIHVQLADGPVMRPRFYAKTSDGWTPQDVSDERFRHVTDLAIGPDGETLVFDYSRADELPQYLVGTYERGSIGETTEWTEINQYLEQRRIPDAEVITWEGAEGATVNGILYYPLDYDPDRAYPLITAIHGGPSGVDLDVWRLGWTIYPGLWAQRGAFVFRPNYHGSGHHGLEFVESIKGRYYELEIPDIVNGINHLVDEGKVDPDSLGVMGWSNGAILTTQLTVEHPEMFKVAAPGAGDVNWISDYGNCAFGVSFDDSYFGGAPWERIDHYIEKSPLFELTKVRTPTLIHHGTEDRAVPYEQGWQYYRALQQIDQAPVRFLSYPNEPHGLRQLSSQRRKVNEDLKWIDTYLFGTTSMEERVNERVVAENAPLAHIQRMQAIARTNGRIGADHDGTLVPEMVPMGDSLMIGRFEVTRAQFNTFRSSYTVAPGTGDYPANGLSAEDARAYVEWLSNETGTTYRLPTEAEMRRLRSRAGKAENDLAHWAGYTPTPEERAKLQTFIEQARTDDLLMPVGSRPPGYASSETESAALLYDLNGNVAEWAESDGELTPMNSSAVTIHDPKATTQTAPPAGYIGLRVVRDVESP